MNVHTRFLRKSRMGSGEFPHESTNLHLYDLRTPLPPNTGSGVRRVDCALYSKAAIQVKSVQGQHSNKFHNARFLMIENDATLQQMEESPFAHQIPMIRIADMIPIRFGTRDRDSLPRLKKNTCEDDRLACFIMKFIMKDVPAQTRCPRGDVAVFNSAIGQKIRPLWKSSRVPSR